MAHYSQVTTIHIFTFKIIERTFDIIYSIFCHLNMIERPSNSRKINRKVYSRFAKKFQIGFGIRSSQTYVHHYCMQHYDKDYRDHTLKSITIALARIIMH